MHRLPRLSLTLLAISVLAACAVGPQYVKPLTPPITLASSQATQFKAAHPQAAWWTFLDEPALAPLIAAALAHNHDIREAQANLRAARAVFDERELDRLPGATAQAAYRRSVEQQAGVIGKPERRLAESWRAGFDAQWEIDLFGRLDRLSRSAQARADAAQADLQQVRLTIAAEVARSYYEQVGLQRGLVVARAQTRSWRDTLTLVQSRVDLGSGLREEGENARAELLRSEAAIPPLMAAIDAVQYRLDVLTGQRPGHLAVATPSTSPPPLARQLPLGDVDALIRNRPDVVGAERLLAASTDDVGAATADQYPRLNLGGFIGFFALRGGDLGSASRAFELAPSLNWPAFRMGNARARLRGAQAQSDGALARYAQALLQAQEDVENAVTRLARHQDRLAWLLQSAAHGTAALDLSTARYRAGAGSYLAVLENQRTLFQIRQDVSEAETASYLNAISLYKALGWGVDDVLADGGIRLAL